MTWKTPGWCNIELVSAMGTKQMWGVISSTYGHICLSCRSVLGWHKSPRLHLKCLWPNGWLSGEMPWTWSWHGADSERVLTSLRICWYMKSPWQTVSTNIWTCSATGCACKWIKAPSGNSWSSAEMIPWPECRAMQSWTPKGKQSCQRACQSKVSKLPCVGNCKPNGLAWDPFAWCAMMRTLDDGGWLSV